jgi:hypothetical protein
MRWIILLLVAYTVTACSTQQYLTYGVPTEPKITLLPRPEKILVVNTTNAAIYHGRKNKEQVVRQLGDTLVKSISSQVSERAGIATHPLYGTTLIKENGDSSLSALMAHYGATHAIVIQNIDVYFDQTAVEVTKTSSGKSREAFYDICSLIDYQILDRHGMIDRGAIRHCKKHSRRSVVSGLLAAGPGIGSNSKAFYTLGLENKDRFLTRYLPGTVVRKRLFNTAAPFNAVSTALKKEDYQLAFEESLKWSDSGNKLTAAKALYNCAVLCEQKHDLTMARRYLEQSIQKSWTPEAGAMRSSLNQNE